MVRVGKNELVGIYNTYYQKWSVPCKYDDVKPRDSGLYHVRKNEKWGALHHDGKLKIPIEYDEISGYKIRKGNKWGMYNFHGKMILPLKYDEIHNQYRVKVGKYWGLLDNNQNWVLSPEYDEIQGDIRGAKIMKDNQVGYIDYFRKILIPTDYDDIKQVKYIKPILFFAKKNNKWGMVDKDANPITPFKYDKLVVRTEIISFQNGKCGLMDREGKELTPQIFTKISKYAHGAKGPFLRVEQDGKFGIINTLGNWILPCQFDGVGSFHFNKFIEEPKLFPVEKNRKMGFAKEGGKVVIPFLFDQVKQFNQGVSIVVKNGKTFLINEKGNQITKKHYDNIYRVRQGETTMIVDRDEKRGLIDNKGNEILPPIYDTMYQVGGIYNSKLITVFLTENDGVQKFFSLEGKLLSIKAKKIEKSGQLPSVYSFEDLSSEDRN